MFIESHVPGKAWQLLQQTRGGQNLRHTHALTARTKQDEGLSSQFQKTKPEWPINIRTEPPPTQRTSDDVGGRPVGKNDEQVGHAHVPAETSLKTQHSE